MSEPIEFQSASVDNNIVVAAGKILFYFNLLYTYCISRFIRKNIFCELKKYFL